MLREELHRLGTQKGQQRGLTSRDRIVNHKSGVLTLGITGKEGAGVLNTKEVVVLQLNLAKISGVQVMTDGSFGKVETMARPLST